MLQRDCGATTSYSYMLFIVPVGQEVDGEKPVFVADNVKNLNFKWIKPKLLNISYDEARIFEFSNFKQSKELDNFSYVVELKLNSNSDRFFLNEQKRGLRR